MSKLQDLFIAIVNMSIAASYVAIGVIFIRLLLKKAPKIFSYILWAPVLFRLVCPISFDSEFSFFNLINLNGKQGSKALAFVPQNIGLLQTPVIQTGIDSIDNAVNASMPSAIPAASVNPMQIWLAVFSLIWILGVIALLIYGIVSYAKIKSKLQTATRVDDNVFETDTIEAAFVCGFIRPKVYVPADIEDATLSYILEHERTHIRRKDYLIKPIAFLALIVHWFNPLMWLCFALMSRDMEMSCDESVLQKLGEGIKGSYSNSLLSLSVKKKGLLAANPLAFGENHVKARIKNVLNFNKPAFKVIIITVLVVCAVTIAFATNPKYKQNDKDLYLGYSIQALLDNKTPYVGNNSKVIGLIDAMPLPKGISRNIVELQTAKLPYGITINYIMNDSSGLEINGAISGDAFYRNAIVLFSLINNADVINCKITDKTGKYNGASYVFTYTRKMAEELIGKDLRLFAQSPDTIRNLIGMIDDISFQENHNNIKRYIEENLAAIMSSPKNSSDPQDYINAHQAEYNAILALETQALPYLFAEFEKGEQTGLKGYIMQNLCWDILGENNIQYTSKNPQDWYDTFKKHVQRIAASSSIDSLRINNPEYSALLDVINTSDTGRVAEIVEKNISIIMSSPKESSNTYDYINMHKEEYEKILGIGKEALPYLIGILESGDKGLRGNIVAILCQDIVKKLLDENKNIDSETERLIKETQTAIDKWNALMRNTVSMQHEFLLRATKYLSQQFS